MPYVAVGSTPVHALFQERNYRLLFAGQGLALLGEQINLIALPWLALQFSGNGLALGSVLAIGGIPPALLMLFGGAMTDRLSPRTLMVTVDALRLVLVSVLVLLVLTGSVRLWTLYPVSLAFGLLSAFAMPAASSITRALLPDGTLQAGNSFFQSLGTVAGILGPALGGFLLAMGKTPDGAMPESPPFPVIGLALALVIYGLGLAISVLTLWRVQTPPSTAALGRRGLSGLLDDLQTPLDYARREPLLRLLIFVLITLNLLLIGPLTVGVPMIAASRLPGGSAAFGLLVAAFSAGSLVGYLLAGFWRQSRGTGPLLIAVLSGFGVGLYALSWVRDVWIALIVPFVLGADNGYLSIILRTLLQQTTPRDLVGRVMSMYLFARTALVPVSQMASGVVILWSLDGLFWGAGTLLLVLAGSIAFSPVPRLFERQVEQPRTERDHL